MTVSSSTSGTVPRAANDLSLVEIEDRDYGRGP